MDCITRHVGYYKGMNNAATNQNSSTEKGSTMEIINYLIQNGQTELTTLMGIFGIDATLAVVQTDSRIVIEFSMLRGNLISV